ncbi:MAG: hypothetical protein WC323_04680 [Patescibacteria group bacterium]
MTQRNFTSGFVIRTKGGYVASGEKISELLRDARFFIANGKALEKWQSDHFGMEHELIPARQSDAKHISLTRGSL